MSTSWLSVRPAEPRDGLAIARINIAAWEAAYAHIFPAERLASRWTNVERAEGWWTRRIESGEPPHRTVIAEQERQVVGFADTGPSRDDDANPHQTGEVNLIYVQLLRMRALAGPGRGQDATASVTGPCGAVIGSLLRAHGADDERTRSVPTSAPPACR